MAASPRGIETLHGRNEQPRVGLITRIRIAHPSLHVLDDAEIGGWFNVRWFNDALNPDLNLNGFALRGSEDVGALQKDVFVEIRRDEGVAAPIIRAVARANPILLVKRNHESRSYCHFCSPESQFCEGSP